MRSLQGLLSEVAYLQRSCEYLLQSLLDIETVANNIEHLDPLQESMVETATQQSASAIKGEIDLAARLAEHWKTAVEYAAG
jgi:prefoldin subunit 5